jgi:hypothetical protein
VPNGTLVAFSTNVGTMANSALTTGGSASSQLSIPAGFSGPEVVTVTSGTVSSSIVVPLAGCAAGGTAPAAAVVPQTTQPSTTAPSTTQQQTAGIQQQAVPPSIGAAISPPSTGDAGLAAQ